MSGPWTADATAIDLLEHGSSPFNQRAYRTAFVAATPGAGDVSFGARLADGTRAAIALIRQGRAATSLPLGYGGPVSDRPLRAAEATSLLTAARAAADVRSLVAYELAIGAAASLPDGGRRQIATTSIVRLDGDPAAGLAKKARQSIRRAERAGAQPPVVGADPATFLQLYVGAAGRRAITYPPALFGDLGAAGAARFYDVLIDGGPASSLAVLVGGDHWMYWAAAQNEAGRGAEAGYLAVASMLDDAWRAGAVAVNLGGSRSGGEDLEGVAQFKRRLGGVEAPVFERRSAALTSRVVGGVRSRLRALRD